MSKFSNSSVSQNLSMSCFDWSKSANMSLYGGSNITSHNGDHVRLTWDTCVGNNEQIVGQEFSLATVILSIHEEFLMISNT